MSIVTLTTDLGYRDPYLAIVKARLFSGKLVPDIIDLSCETRENAISDAAFILKNALQYFPPGTIHLVAIKFIADKSDLNRNGHADNSRFLVTLYKDQYIITPDTGLFTLLDAAF